MANEGEYAGKWTMVYDEGFEIRIANSVFFAFSKYKNIGNLVNISYQNPKDDDDEQTKGY